MQIPQFKRKKKGPTYIGVFVGLYQAQAYHKNKKVN